MLRRLFQGSYGPLLRLTACDPSKVFFCPSQFRFLSKTRVLHEEVTPVKVKVIDGDGNSIDITPVSEFVNMFEKLPKWLTANIQRLEYKKPTAIQAYTIPVLLDGNDAVGLAPTGSGKTMAFAVPSLAQMKASAQGHPSILVVAPVRELVQQIAKVFQQLVDAPNGMRVCCAYGGAPRGHQVSEIMRGCDVLVATPGRLNDFLQSNIVSLSHVNFIVFDEADRLLDMGFKPQLDDIMQYTDHSRPAQVMMWSATWPKEVQHLANDFLGPKRMLVRAGGAGQGLSINTDIRQHVLLVRDNREKLEELITLAESKKINFMDQTIVFVEQKVMCEVVAEQLIRSLSSKGLVGRQGVVAIHGGMDQSARDRVIGAFKCSSVTVLVATDVAARGLDFPEVKTVVNFDCPKTIEMYCHRIGRTARAGRRGDAYTFMDRMRGILPEVVEYMLKCKQLVPDDLKRAAEEQKISGYTKRSRGREFNDYGRARERRAERSEFDGYNSSYGRASTNSRSAASDDWD